LIFSGNAAAMPAKATMAYLTILRAVEKGLEMDYRIE
jgi:hypothetical protein